MPKNTSVLIHVALERTARLLRSLDYGASLNPAQWQALRYLSRCNRFSNSQHLLGRYLAATKGTVSQTLASLVAKGYLKKIPRPGGGQTLLLTERGRKMLENDPAGKLLDTLDRYAAAERKALLNDLEAMILDSLLKEDGAGFGTCRNCTHFQGSHKTSGSKRAICQLFGEPVKKKESRKLCAHFVRRPVE